MPVSGQCRRALRAGTGASDRGDAPGHDPAGLFLPRRLFHAAGRAPFRRLIYPVPVAGGLGVHITLDLAGQARFGPDVEWISAVDYRVDPARGKVFYAAVRTYWPGLQDGALQPGYAGIRPKISGPADPAADFVVQGPETHGVPGLVNLYGIEFAGAYRVAAARRRGGAKTPLRRDLIEETPLSTKAPERKRLSEHVGKAVTEDAHLVAPMEIVRQRPTRDQRKQHGTDREINQSELDERFPTVITVNKAGNLATVSTSSGLHTRWSPVRDGVSRKQPKP